jgi:hypothetical protein
MDDGSRNEGRVANPGRADATIVVMLNTVLIGVGGLYTTTGSLVVVIVAAMLAATLVACLTWIRQPPGSRRKG